MAALEDSNDAVWNQSVLCNKSWADMVEEDERIHNVSSLSSSTVHVSPLLRDSTNLKHKDVKGILKDEPVDDESACDIKLNGETKEIKIQPSDVLPNFSVSHTKKTEDASKENTTKNRPSDPKDFLQDDLSLTSHLNGFKLVSPCKVDQKTPTKTPVKTSISQFLNRGVREEGSSSPREKTKRKLKPDDEDSEVTDEMLMPSPSKMMRHNTPRQNKDSNTPKRKSDTPKQTLTPNFLPYTPTNRITRKRSREATPKGSSTEKRTPREQETDPDVIARRQKQIEYGKNTVGYDRYRQLVPKEARTKMHPKTPPIHLKFSRRAWDGMIKVWRQRLHFWDPPSEGGGNPECLRMDDDASSTDGSLPATPVQEKKRQRWQRNTPGSSREEGLDDDEEDDGCTPLPPEDE